MEADKKKKSKLNTILNKYHKLFGILIFVIVLALGSFFLIWPEIVKDQKIAKEFLPGKMEELALLNKYTAKIKELETLISNIDNQYGQSLNLLRQVLPEQAKVPELIAQLDALTRRSGFIINSIDVTESLASTASKKGVKTTNNTPLRLLNINLNVTGGNYPAFKILLDNIENNIRLLDLNSINFSNSSGEAVSYSLNLRTYYFVDSLTGATSAVK